MWELDDLSLTKEKQFCIFKKNIYSAIDLVAEFLQKLLISKYGKKQNISTFSLLKSSKKLAIDLYIWTSNEKKARIKKIIKNEIFRWTICRLPGC